jgi:hypothetical protein
VSVGSSLDARTTGIERGDRYLNLRRPAITLTSLLHAFFMTSASQGLLIQIKAFKEQLHTVPWLSGGNTREKQAVMTEPR